MRNMRFQLNGKLKTIGAHDVWYLSYILKIKIILWRGEADNGFRRTSTDRYNYTSASLNKGSRPLRSGKLSQQCWNEELMRGCKVLLAEHLFFLIWYKRNYDIFLCVICNEFFLIQLTRFCKILLANPDNFLLFLFVFYTLYILCS